MSGARPRAIVGDRAEIVLVWLAFLVTHIVLGVINLTSPTNPFGDVRSIYRNWVADAVAGTVPGIDVPWVYPVLALVPLLLAAAVAVGMGDPDLYPVGWLVVVAAVTVPLLIALTVPRRNRAATRIRRNAAWFLVIFTMTLGPIAIGRIDAITLPIGVAALLALRRFPVVAGALCAVGAWIKVWPFAPFVAAFVGARAPWRLVAGGAGVTAVVAGGAIALGGWPEVASFVTEQTGRGLQIEAPAATWPMLLAALGDASYRVGYDTDILTYQVTGPGTALISAAMTPFMVGLVAVVAAIGLLARRAGASSVRVVPPLALALVLALILGNKVGSPQFVVWIGAVVTAWLVLDHRRALIPAALTLALAGLTQLVYPWNYDLVIAPTLSGFVILALRNALYVALFVVIVRTLWRARRLRAREH